MKKIFCLTLIISAFCTSLFSQPVRRLQAPMQRTTTVVPVQPATTSHPASLPIEQSRPISEKAVASRLVFLNLRDTKHGILAMKTVAPINNNNMVRMFEFTKDIRYSDGTVLHMRLKKNPTFGGQSAEVKANAKQTGQDDGNGMTCITSNVSLTATSTDFMNNNYSIQTSHIYPGAIYTYEHLYDGSFREETANRNPIVIGCDNPNMQFPTYETVTDPSQATINNALSKLFSRFNGDAANESLAYQVFESANNADMNIKVGAGGSGYGFSFNNVFSTQSQDNHVYMTIDARKSLFTMSAALPDSGYFSTHVPSSSPLVIMGSVSYGVRILANMEFTFVSKEEADNFKAAYLKRLPGQIKPSRRTAETRI